MLQKNLSSEPPSSTKIPKKSRTSNPDEAFRRLT